MLTFLLASGYYVQVTPAWIGWLKYVSFSYYCFKLQLASQYSQNQTYPCPTGRCLVKDYPAIHVVGLDHIGLAAMAMAIMLIAYRFLTYIALMRIKGYENWWSEDCMVLLTTKNSAIRHTLNQLEVLGFSPLQRFMPTLAWKQICHSLANWFGSSPIHRSMISASGPIFILSVCVCVCVIICCKHPCRSEQHSFVVSLFLFLLLYGDYCIKRFFKRHMN